MTVFEMRAALRTSGGYVTPPGHARRPLPCAVATPLYHLRLFTIFLGGYFRARRPDFEQRGWADFCYRLHRITEFLGGRIRFEGFEQVREARFPVVWVANHISALETYLLPEILTIYSSLTIVLKESLAHYPLFGQVVRAVRPIRLERKSAIEDLRKVLSEGLEGIRAGRSVLIFPQGQRQVLFAPATFNAMGVKLAQRANVPVVPLAVRTDYLKLGRWIKELVTVHPRRPVRIACGPVLSPALSPRALQTACTDFIVTKLAEWEATDGDALLAAVSRPEASPANGLPA